jgi:uncharacterized protein YggE
MQNTGIWVSGTGEVTVTPDIAVLQVGVEAQEDTVAEALDKANSAVALVMTALTDSGVESKDIQTQYFNISQRTRWDDRYEEETVVGYRVTNRMTVKIRLLPVDSYTLDYKASRVIDAVVKAGGDLIRIDSFNFSVDDPAVYYDEAREKASADAKAKAEKLAEQNGVSLGEPTYISESSATPYSYEHAVPVPVALGTSDTQVSPGEIVITLTVQIAYSIK